MALGILIFINSRYFRTVLMLFYTQLFRRVEKWFHLLQVQSMVRSQVLALSQPYNWTGFYSHQECIGTWGIYRIWGESFFNHLRPSRFLRSVFGGNWSGNKQIETAVFIFDIYISLETIFPQDTCIQQCFIHSQYGLQNSFFSKQTNTWPSNHSQSCRIFLKLKVVQRFFFL